MLSDRQVREELSLQFKLRHDSKIPPKIGSSFRRDSLDELPQVFNVVAGEIHLVGPCPLPDHYVAAMDGRSQAVRGFVTFGLTGLWQISERSFAELPRLQQLED
jgi:lipopolysaccharide/colanic/teichoic acid biosynthesis glycosyltransferase